MDFNIFYENLILVPTVGFLVAVILKGFLSKMNSGFFNLKRALSSGGMPSAHSAVVTSLTMGVALKYGISSDLFAICFAFTVIIIYDAINVRYEAGQHATAINKLLGEKFKEQLGHLPSEAFAGSILGIILALILYMY